jgi:hypothetical protein
VIVDWTVEFDCWLTNAEEQGGKLLTVAVALLQALNDLSAKPDEEPRPSSGSGRLAVMSCGGLPTPMIRTSPSGSPADPSADDHAVLALVGFDKKAIGDLFYASTAARGEALVDAWLPQKGHTHD